MNKWQLFIEQANTTSFSSPEVLLRQFKKLWLSRLLTANLLVLFLQYEGLMLTTLNFSYSPLWFATGTAFGFMFLRGVRILPGVALGTFFAYCHAKSGLLFGGYAGVLFTAEAYLLVALCYRHSFVFYERRLFCQFILCSLAITGFVSFALVAGYYFMFSPQAELLTLWFSWWLANVNGVLIFGLGLIALDAFFPQFNQLQQVNKKLISFLYGGLFLIVLCILFSTEPLVTLLLMNMTLPLTLMISRRYGWCGAVTAFFIMGFLFGISTILGSPMWKTPFSTETYFFVASFLAIETVIALYFAINRVRYWP